MRGCIDNYFVHLDQILKQTRRRWIDECWARQREQVLNGSNDYQAVRSTAIRAAGTAPSGKQILSAKQGDNIDLTVPPDNFPVPTSSATLSRPTFLNQIRTPAAKLNTARASCGAKQVPIPRGFGRDLQKATPSQFPQNPPGLRGVILHSAFLFDQVGHAP